MIYYKTENMILTNSNGQQSAYTLLSFSEEGNKERKTILCINIYIMSRVYIAIVNSQLCLVKKIAQDLLESKFHRY